MTASEAHSTWQDAQGAVETMAAHATRCTKALQAGSGDGLDLTVSHRQPGTARLHREGQWRKVASTCSVCASAAESQSAGTVVQLNTSVM
jgi:hypothetical protein